MPDFRVYPGNPENFKRGCPMINKTHALTWVVVADNSRAAIYKSTQFPKLEQVAELGHPEAKLQNQDLTASEPGRGFQRGGVTRHAYESKTEPKQLELAKFATEVANFLNRSLRDEKYNRLFIIAAPSFLGELRRHTSAQVRRIVVSELAKDLTSFDIKSLEKYYSEM